MVDFHNDVEAVPEIFREDVDEEPGDFGHSMKFNTVVVANPAAAAPEPEIKSGDFDDLPSQYQTFIHRSKYARFRDDLGRRETWTETVTRYVDFFSDHLKTKCGYSMSPEEYSSTREAIGNLSVMPSMRALMTAGQALKRDNIAGYNCAYIAVDEIFAFDEILYVLMNGTGVGFSCERQYVSQLPTIPTFRGSKEEHVITVGDSKEGWAFALRHLMVYLYGGIIPKWNLENLRPAGARLMTFGGRSSGPRPLDDLFKFVVATFKNASGRKLTSLEVHDIVCKIAEIVVVGGVRRCIPAGALVHSDRGLVRIEEIAVGDKVMTVDGYRPVLNTFVQGPQSVLLIKTKYGNFECTANHRMAVADGDSYKFVQAGDLKIGESLVACPEAITGVKTQLPTLESHDKQVRHSKHKKFVIPELDEDVAWYLGCFQTSSHPRHGYYHPHQPNIDRTRKVVSRFCPGECLGSRRLDWYLNNVISVTDIPDCILRGTLEIRKAYLAGAREVGYQSVDTPKDAQTIFQTPFPDQLQALTASCGLLMVKKNTGKSQRIWLSEMDECGCCPRMSRADVYNLEWIDETSQIMSSEITGIVMESRVAETYDIEVDDRHEFVCNGFLTHNSALLSLSNLSDDRMRTAKSGEWWKENPQRGLANNSVCYTEKPEIGRFMNEWVSLYESKSGERGIFNREGCKAHIKKNCPNRVPNFDAGANPCCEIILRSREFCNLTEVIIRADDTPDSLKHKVRMAAILGTWQASLTDFQYISEKWKKNCEEERLLGVSLTGIMDNAFMSGMYISDSQDGPKSKRARTESPWSGYTLPAFLTELKEVAVETNRLWSKKLGFNSSAAITTVKPSGTVSQLVDSASGIHTRHAKYYIRTVRGDKKDPMTKFLQDEGVPWEPCVTKPNDTVVFSFPVKAPDQCITRDDQTALQQLEICKIYGEYWCHHKVSVTITVKEPEWMQVGSWIWDNFDTTAGMSFLPHSEHTYRQAPYQECDEATYAAAAARMPKINWKKLRRYETSDMTSGAKELACSAGGCEI